MNVGAIAIFLAAGLLFSANTARGYLLPLYAAGVGMDRAQVGLLFSAYAMAAAALALPAGFVIDRVGVRFVLSLSVAVTAASHAVLAWTTRYEVLLGCQFLGGLGSCAAMATLMAALADAAPEAQVGRSMGYLTFSNQVGYLAGPVVGAGLLFWLPLPLTLTTTAALSLAVLPLCLVIADSRVPGSERKPRILHDLAILASKPGFVSFAVALFAAAMLWGTLEAYLPLLGRESMGFTNAEVGLIIALQALINGASRIPAGWFIDRTRSASVVATTCRLAYAVAIAAVPHLKGVYAAIGVSLSVALIASAFVALSTSFAELSGSKSKGAIMGVYVGVLFLGLAIGPAVFGPSMQAQGFKIGFALCGLSAAFLTVTAVTARALRRKSDRKGRSRR